MLLILGILISGLVIGLLARALLPGPDPMGIGATILLGIAGSFIGGLVFRLLFGRQGVGLIGAVLFSMLLLWLVRRSRGGAYV